MQTRFIMGVVVILIMVSGGIFFYADRDKESTPSPAPTHTSTQAEIPGEETIIPYGDVTLKVGDSAAFPDIVLTLVRVFDDSRCPTGVTCIWAGTLKAEIETLSGMGRSTTTVELGKTVTTEAEKITFVSATPHPKEGQNISPKDYQLVFEVKKRGASQGKHPYTVGQDINIVGKVTERIQDCGGGSTCSNGLVVSLPEEMATGDIWSVRMNQNMSCVDKTLQGGEMVKVSGKIVGVVPDIGLILSCDFPGTSVTKI